MTLPIYLTDALKRFEKEAYLSGREDQRREAETIKKTHANIDARLEEIRDVADMT